MALNNKLIEHPSHRALWAKALEGFKFISGQDWEQRADYEHFWPLVRTLYAMAYGPHAKLPEKFIGPLAFMLAGHTGRTRKGLRKRPYFHHILMVVYLTWLLDLPEDIQLAAINHDDIEDIPKNLNVSEEWVIENLHRHIGSPAVTVVKNLSNTFHPDGKHAGQKEKMSLIPVHHGTLKLLDRTTNIYDMRQDKPKGFTPERIQQECTNALELAAAMPEQASEPVLALLVFSVDMLMRENNLAAV